MKHFKYRCKGYWRNQANQRNFLENLARKLGIKDHRDWGKISRAQVYKHGGSGLLNHFNNSVFQTITKAFPGNKSSTL